MHLCTRRLELDCSSLPATVHARLGGAMHRNEQERGCCSCSLAVAGLTDAVAVRALTSGACRQRLLGLAGLAGGRCLRAATLGARRPEMLASGDARGLLG